MKLYPDQPKSKGVENALRRAEQMVRFQWIPIESFPASMNSANPAGKEIVPVWFGPYRPYSGLPYSSVRRFEQYIGFNVSFETFMTALANPDSVLYTRPQHESRGASSYYGTVCSGFVSYAVGFRYRTPNYCLPDQPGITEVDTTTLDNLELCDIIENTKIHVALVTGILRDAEGHVRVITVSESTKPRCISTDFTPEAFRTMWLDMGGYRIYRYAGVHNQTYTPTPYVRLEDDPVLPLPPVNTAFGVNFGNKANIPLGEELLFSVWEKKWERVELTGPDGAVTTLAPVDGRAVYTPEKPGFYTAVCRAGEEASLPVELCVTGATVSADRDVYAPGDEMTLTFRNNAEEKPLLYAINTLLDNERQREYFTADELAAGSAKLRLVLAPGAYYIRTISKNRYGYYVSASFPFRVE